MTPPIFTSFFMTPAKVNLGLKIVRKRDDGYHDLYTVMEPVSLADTLYCEFYPALENSFSVQCPQMMELDTDDNLLVKAARLMSGIARERGVERNGRWDFFLEKKIPAGAGMGGGSSNAAGIIKLFNNFFALKLNFSELVEAATKIGADVPFFLNPELSLVEGVGDRITSLGDPHPRYYLLVKPPFSINTAFAYASLNASRQECAVDYDVEQFKLTARPNRYRLENDFEDPIMELHPLLADIKQELIKSDRVLGTLMSGSGSVVYAVYPDLAAALRAEITTRRQWQEHGCLFYLARNIHTY
ncbi:MAG: 4-(cytidine 5'-diphospho)-2-C-methyl-D-erythritol kinase [Deltaproteobacteria bacterium]|nr:4-(cytidine 5'-diphospho)-2-C-methyl-D-erythritol kinase [Candidatus Tharpella sp.]